MSVLTWTLPVVLGGAIGWATNWIAVKMLFHPHQRRFGMQGLLPRRQADLAQSVGDVIAKELVSVDDLLAPLDGIDLAPQMERLVDAAVAEKVAELRKIPLVGGFITEERVRPIRDGIMRRLVAAQPEVIAGFKRAAKERVDIAAIARTKLAAFNLDRLEGIVQHVANRELRAIEWWGFVLGALIGLVQAAVINLL